MWPKRSKPRQIDGIRIRSEYRDEIRPQKIFTNEQRRSIVDRSHVEVIEVKESLSGYRAGYSWTRPI